MRFIKDTLTTFSAQIAAVLLKLAADILVARALGASGKGAYALIILVPTLLPLLSNLGIGMANLYFGGKKKYDFAQLASNSLVSALGLGMLSSGAFLAYFFVFRPSFFGGVEPLQILLATSIVPFALLNSYLVCILLGQGRIRQYNLLQLTPGAVCFTFTLVLLIAFHTGVWGAVAAYAGGILAASIVAILLVLRSTAIRWSFRPRVFVDTIKFGVQNYLSDVVQFLNYRVDMLIVAYFLTVSDVGYYSIAVIMAEALWYFPGAVGTMVLSRVPRMSEADANRTTPRICRTTLFITGLAALALAGLGRYLISLLYGSEFAPSLKPLWYLLPGVVGLSICKVLSNELAGRGKPAINAVVSGVSLAVNVPLNFVLIPRMGIAGAALASSVSYSVSGLATLAAFVKISGNSWFDTLIIKPEDLRLYVSMFGNLGSRIRAAATGSRE